MTKKELEQYRSIAKEVQEIKYKLKSKTLYDEVTGSDSEFPYIKHRMTVSGLPDTEENCRESRLLKMLQKKKADIESFVDNIDDNELRRIFNYRYIEGSVRPSWTTIAFRVGYHDEQMPRKKHNKYLQMYEKYGKKVI